MKLHRLQNSAITRIITIAAIELSGEMRFRFHEREANLVPIDYRVLT